jgi:nucleolar protein 56
VLKAARASMGMDTSEADMANIVVFTERIISLAEYRKQLYAYLEDKMATVAPNLSSLIGETVAARLIQKAGSLTSLAKCPASTVQILGAEKALFRALKTKGNTPKYGLIYHSSFIGRASAKNKGRISRYLANKCAIASRIDSFIEEPTKAYGEQLRDQVEERLKFYDTGEAPRKNVDVMSAVAEGLRKIATKDAKKKGGDVSAEDEGSKKKKKKDKKRDRDEVRGVMVNVVSSVTNNCMVRAIGGGAA